MPSTLTAVARTPLHDWHAAHGARFAERAGWQVVAAYRNVEQEAAAARAAVGLADVSAVAKHSLRGSGTAAVVHSLVSDAAALAVSRIATVLDGAAIACRLHEDHLLLIGTAATATQRLTDLGHRQAALMTDVTSGLAGFELIGPRLDELLGRLTQHDVRQARLPAGGCAETALAGVEALLVRPANRRLPTVQIYLAWDVAECVWERMLESGRGAVIVPVGVETLAMLG